MPQTYWSSIPMVQLPGSSILKHFSRMGAKVNRSAFCEVLRMGRLWPANLTESSAPMQWTRTLGRRRVGGGEGCHFKAGDRMRSKRLV
jgi:hypothetical protein